MRRGVAVIGVFAVFAASLFASTGAGAADGSLESTLGGDGIANVPSLTYALDVAAAPGSKIVVVGKSGSQPAVVQLNEDGTPDLSFDGDGLMLIPMPVGATNGTASAVAVHSDGSMAVVGGFGFDGEFTARISSTGTLIGAFGGTGIVYTDFLGIGASHDVAVTSAGVVYRLFVCCGAPPYVAVYKYSATGTESAPIELGTVPAGYQAFDPYHIVLQSNGLPLVTGSTIDTSNGKTRLAVVRLNSAGAKDSTFSGDGLAIIGHGDFAAGALVGDKLVVAGTYTVSGTQYVSVAKLTSTGTADTAFGGGDGLDERAAPAGMDRLSDVVARIDNRFYLVSAPSGTGTNFVVQRRLTNGSPDLSFSGDGLATIPSGVTFETTAGATGPLGDLLVLGGLSGTSVVARIDGTDTAAPTGAVVTAPTARFVLATTYAPHWTATDPSGIGGYEVQRIVAAHNAALPTTWGAFYTGKATTASSLSGRGKTQCFRERAKDVWDNFSAYSAARCVAVPLGSAQLTYSSGWTAKNVSSAYSGAVRTTKANGKTAKVTGVYAKRVALVVTKCASCGAVKVKYTGTIGAGAVNLTSPTVSLVSSSTKTKQIVELAPLSGLFHGTVTVQVTSATGKTVTIEGLGIFKN